MSEQRYVFGDSATEVETERLDLLEALLDPLTHERIRRLGVPRGSRCLEVGAGGNSVTLFLLSLCGKFGEVVATDIDTRWLETTSHPCFSYLKHNIVMDDVESLGTFDFIHSRALLNHLGRERATGTVERLVGMLRPGGRILIEDYAMYRAADPSHPDAVSWIRNWERWNDFFSQTGDLNIGTVLPGLFARLGLIEVDNEMKTTMARGGDVARQWLAHSIESIRPLLEEEGIFDVSVDEMLRMTNDPTLASTIQLDAATWGRRER